MSSCFQSFKYSSYIVCCVSKHKSQAREKKVPAFVNLQSSIIPQAEESSNSPDCRRNSFLNKPMRNSNAVGIIGGAMINSTLNFVKKLNLQDEENGLPFVLCSDPILSKELLDLERSSCRFLSGKNEYASTDQSSTVQNLRHKRTFLEKSGVSCIVMPCHISHCWHDEVADGCSVPFLHMGECVAKELKEAKLRPLEAGSSPRIGVLATNATLTARFYQEKLQNEEALSKKDIEGAQNLFRIAMQVLLVRAVNTVILASDNVWELLPPNDPLWKKCIDPMDALARSTVKYAQSADRGK
ncbi:aspartate-glutamate racemase family [Abeliophyllum distichum]|uniref:Aspartate-glutamate racemase family n=1 Tax=Abeliophyllum distichum TaxID=126358 RepID=A0ABD1VPK6_9LAMI